MKARRPTGGFSQSFVLISIVSLISVGAVFLCSICLAAGLRLNANATQHPYDHFTSWRYGLGLAMPVLMMILSWIYRARPDISMLDVLHMALAWSTIGWMAVVTFYEILVWSQCHDLTATLAFDHPQCANRNYPTNTHPDISWELYFIGAIINTACAAYWVIFSFQLESSYNSMAYRQRVSEAQLSELDVNTTGIASKITTEPRRFVNVNFPNTKIANKYSSR